MNGPSIPDRFFESQGLHPFLSCFSLFAFLFNGGFLKKTSLLYLLEETFLLELAFKRFQRFFYIISINLYIQNILSPSSSGTPIFAGPAAPVSEIAFAETALFSRLLGSGFTHRQSPLHK
jgi:hypothetical protein